MLIFFLCLIFFVAQFFQCSIFRSPFSVAFLRFRFELLLSLLPFVYIDDIRFVDLITVAHFFRCPNYRLPFFRGYIHCVSKKVPTFKLSVTLSNLNRFLKFCAAGKRTKVATEPIRHYPPHLRYVAALRWEIKNLNCLQIFSRYGRNRKQIAF